MKVRTTYHGPTDTKGSRVTVRWEGHARTVPYSHAARDAIRHAIEQATGIPAALARDVTTYSGPTMPTRQTFQVPTRPPRVWRDRLDHWHAEVFLTPGDTGYDPTLMPTGRSGPQEVARRILTPAILAHDPRRDPATIAPVWEAPGHAVEDGPDLLCRFTDDRAESVFVARHPDGRTDYISALDLRACGAGIEYDAETDTFRTARPGPIWRRHHILPADDYAYLDED